MKTAKAWCILDPTGKPIAASVTAHKRRVWNVAILRAMGRLCAATSQADTAILYGQGYRVARVRITQEFPK